MKSFIHLEDVTFEYDQSSLEPLIAVNNVSMEINRGMHVAVLGRNGSGKSTLARLICGLESVKEGRIEVDGMEHDGGKNSFEIRRKCGIVFQNPDNQIIGTTVEEDIAFGPENLGVAREEMIRRIDEVLPIVGLEDKRGNAPNTLSGGQKQKLAIAGILVMQPECIIMDEATSMLDPSSRAEFLDFIFDLKEKRNLTIINITHDMQEAVLADYVYIMDEGRVVFQGAPRYVFDNLELIRSYGLDVPVHIDIVDRLSKLIGIDRTPGASFEQEEAVEEILRIGSVFLDKDREPFTQDPDTSVSVSDKLTEASSQGLDGRKSEQSREVLKVENLSHTYSQKTAFANHALNDVSFELEAGELLGIVGHTGSGKSTLIQHFNGLLRPQAGKVILMGFDTSVKKEIRELRKHAGLLFQYPEHQLFEENVFRDIAFGPKNLGMPEDYIEKMVYSSLEAVGLDKDLAEKSPFELSGGQKRRVAIAGILAMEPDILILDEPAAGLDPAGREEILDFVKSLQSKGRTVILVSHNMDDIAKLADRILVLKEGNMKSLLSPGELFAEGRDLAEEGISRPLIMNFMDLLKQKMPEIRTDVFDAEAAALEVAGLWLKKKEEAS